MLINQRHRRYNKPKWRQTLLRAYALLIAYRFREQLGPPLRLYKPYAQELLDEKIQEKARASLATSGVFLGFTIAVLAALIVAKDLYPRLNCGLHAVRSWKGLLVFLLNILLPYLLIREERSISAVASIERKTEQEKERIRERRYRCLLTVLLFSILTPAALPLIFRQSTDNALPLPYVFSVSGFFLVVLSAFFLFLSLELYDYAAAWRRGRELHFHLASIASHSMSFGVSTALVGVSLLLCLLNFWLGRIVTCVSLIVVFAMPEIERQLGDWRFDLPSLAALVEASALKGKFERVCELTEMSELAEVKAQRASGQENNKKRNTSLLCKILIAFYRTWANVCLSKPYDEQLKIWKNLLDEAQIEGGSFRGFWSFDQAKEFLGTSNITETQQKLLQPMIEAMEKVGQADSPLPLHGGSPG